MLKSRRMIVVAALGLATCLFSSHNAHAHSLRTYRVVGIANKTTINVNYSLRVGSRSPMKAYRVNRGRVRWHWTTGSASPRIRFDYNLARRGVQAKTYRLPYRTVRSYRNPTWSQARKYKFLHPRAVIFCITSPCPNRDFRSIELYTY